jgi:aryl-alcohol dehydrogenase-like predicted oxidoreductase
MTHARQIAPTFAFPDGRAVSRIGYGAMRLTGQPRNFGPYEDWAGGIALLRRAAELGVDHVDTARAYGPHANERLVAEALAPLATRAFVASKGGVEKDEASIRRDGSPEALARHIEESRRDLAPLIGDRPIDLYYLHQPDPEVPLAESVRALEAARRAGRIARIGLSNVSLAQLREAMEVAPVSAVQNRYSPADARDAGTEALIDFTAEHGIAFVAHGPLGAHPMRRGAATGPGEALRTLLARAPNILAIPGTTAPAHLEENVRALDGGGAPGAPGAAADGDAPRPARGPEQVRGA